ncbi:hypothetical protein F164LOC_18110 [Pectobacterium carotovorum]|nr:hypothetical protein F164LOC_18110 [Pectobacterium carotovorum]
MSKYLLLNGDTAPALVMFSAFVIMWIILIKISLSMKLRYPAWIWKILHVVSIVICGVLILAIVIFIFMFPY